MKYRAVGSATARDLEVAEGVLRRRLNLAGVEDADVARRRDFIVVTIPPRFVKLAPILGRTGRLQVYDFERDLVRASQSKRQGRVLICTAYTGSCPSPGTMNAMFVVRRAPGLTGRDIRADSVRAVLDPQTSQPIVVMRFTDRGRRLFRGMTRRVARRAAQARGCSRGVLAKVQHVAIALDVQLISIPYVDYCKFPDGIPADNGIQIALSSIAEAKALALQLRSGALPVRFVRVR